MRMAARIVEDNENTMFAVSISMSWSCLLESVICVPLTEGADASQDSLILT